MQALFSTSVFSWLSLQQLLECTRVSGEEMGQKELLAWLWEELRKGQSIFVIYAVAVIDDEACGDYFKERSACSVHDSKKIGKGIRWIACTISHDE